ncbi:NAD(P)H-hydrate dehydratase [Candidatus Woesebacteria bacterium]|nr:NAD(P)H-hydrate dehydratase [Candidatus Woesebacteria bacterium]
MQNSTEIQFYLDQIKIPDPSSHKGQNGKLLVIGGSELFHSSIFWSADVASKIVDMVHFTSPANENNELVRNKIKEGFWSGIVVDWSEVEFYVGEDDAILIGPGMDRSETTQAVTSQLVGKFPEKKWVIDGGALQMIDPTLLNANHIITPHHKELEIVLNKLDANDPAQALEKLIATGAVILSKGEVDHVLQQQNDIPVTGGNAGMTKGGTGDVLAGLVAALYCLYDPMTAAVVGSLVNKRAAEDLWQTVGPNFSAGDLVTQVPKTFWRLLQAR